MATAFEFQSGNIEFRSANQAPTDTSLPVFSGISSATPNTDGSIGLAWSLGTSSKPPLMYDIYISLGSVSAAALFVNSNIVRIAPSGATSSRVFMLPDQVTYLVKGQQYTLGVRARDAFNYKDGNTAIQVVTAIASGNLPTVFQTMFDQIAATEVLLAADHVNFQTDHTNFQTDHTNLNQDHVNLAADIVTLGNLNTAYSALNTAYGNLNTTYSGLNSTFSGYLTSFNGMLSTLLTDIGNLQTEVSLLTTQVGTLTTDVSNLTTQVTQLTTDVTTLTAQLITLATDISNLASTSSDIAASEVLLAQDVADMTVQVAQLTADVAALSVLIGAKPIPTASVTAYAVGESNVTAVINESDSLVTI